MVERPPPRPCHGRPRVPGPAVSLRGRLPALRGGDEVEAHLRAEFEGVEVPAWFRAGLGLTGHVPGGPAITAALSRRGIDRMAQQFVVGTDPDEVADAAAQLWNRHTAVTVDLLGEHTHSEVEADRYAVRCRRARRRAWRQRRGRGCPTTTPRCRRPGTRYRVPV